MSSWDVRKIREDFPILNASVHGKSLAYLDNAATSQKPRAVLDAMARFYTEENSNVHRGAHHLSERATAAYERARTIVQKHLNAAHLDEVVFTRGTTESANLVAQGFSYSLKSQDAVVVTSMEHHSNWVPWQLAAQRSGAVFRVIPMDARGNLRWRETLDAWSDRAKILAITHVSNVLGTINPLKEIIQAAHARGIAVFVDGAQAIPHLKVDVQELGCDFYAFSSHKAYGPTGIGALYGRREWLDRLPPYQSGGGMIQHVSEKGTTFQKAPMKFEAGTPSIAEAVGLGVALNYLNGLNLPDVQAYEADLLKYGAHLLSKIPGLRMLGAPEHRASLLTFTLEGVHAHDVATILDRKGVAIRAGHHCAQPLADHFGVSSSVRASFSFYNTAEEIDRLAQGLSSVREMFH